MTTPRRARDGRPAIRRRARRLMGRLASPHVPSGTGTLALGWEPRHGWSLREPGELDTRRLVPEQGVEGPMSCDGPRAVPRCDQRDPARHARDRVTHQRTPRCTGRPGSAAAHGARTSARADLGTPGSRWRPPHIEPAPAANPCCVRPALRRRSRRRFMTCDHAMASDSCKAILGMSRRGPRYPAELLRVARDLGE